MFEKSKAVEEMNCSNAARMNLLMARHNRRTVAPLTPAEAVELHQLVTEAEAIANASASRLAAHGRRIRAAARRAPQSPPRAAQEMRCPT